MLDLDSEAEVRDGVEHLARRFGSRLDGVLVQPTAPPGVEVLVGMTLDEVVGPMLTLGRGGTATDLLGDGRRHLLVPAGASEAGGALEQAGLGAAVLGRHSLRCRTW
ncbi:acetate--CoA ligase family protein [Pseudonocardia parietis]|uniref:Acyl-CoA synthetase (NDP forming) n=1 Tax=Pseudonocardia parietis TaxID=570936 RepID=A0ABS4VWT0_9PSEU|nr:acetate--CoA ligase family protein [Pseudonocardia parietis]MBP2368183.1 acyl-CoA synthetase (NDP forming) [Pseudonocardia parietis]